MGVLRSVGTVIGGLNAIDATAGSGLRWIGLRLRNATLYTVATVQHAALSSASAIRDAVLFTTSGLAAGAARAGTGFTGPHPRSAAPRRGAMALSRPRRRFRIRSGRARREAFVGSRAAQGRCAAAETIAPVLSSAAAGAPLRRRSRGGWRPERLPARICGAPPTAPGRHWRARRPLRRRAKTRYPCRTG